MGLFQDGWKTDRKVMGIPGVPSDLSQVVYSRGTEGISGAAAKLKDL